MNKTKKELFTKVLLTETNVRLIILLFITTFALPNTHAESTDNLHMKYKDLKQGEKIIINGTVSNHEGETLPGVNVLERGTNNGTTTNIDGQYTIEVDKEAILVFSFVGYLSEQIPVEGTSKIDVVLIPDLQELESVVVVGYAVKEKENLTGAVSTVSSEEIESRPVTGLNEALNGAVPNLQISPTQGGKPGSDAVYQIRGLGTIGNASSEPLFIVDGVETDPNLINPNDIASISVLKDAAAASIYGAKASYGVIIITTKEGKEGDTKINFSANQSWRSPQRRFTRLGTIKHMEYWREADINEDGEIYSGSRARYGYPDIIYEAAKARVKDPSLPNMLVNPDDPSEWWAGLAIDEDWYEAFMNSYAPTQDINLSVSGGNGKSNYYFSGGYLNQDGLIKFDNDHYKRYSFLGKFSGNVNDWMELSYRLQYLRRDILSGTEGDDEGALENWIYSNNPSIPVFDPNGHPTQNEMARVLHKAYHDRDIEDNFNNTFSANISLFKGFSLVSDFSFNLSSLDNLYYQNRYPMYNVYNEIEYYDGISEMSKEKNKLKFYDIDIHGSYFRRYNGHKLSILAGYQQQYTKDSRVYIYRDEKMADNINSIVTATGEQLKVTDEDRELATLSFFGRLNYSYNEKLLLEMNFRYDGNSRFGEEHRWGFFPSVSGGYILSKEDYFDFLSEWINFMKIRGSYGRLGNMKTNYWYFNQLATMNRVLPENPWLTSDGKALEYMTAPGLSNEYLTWEKPTTINFGMDMNFFKNKIQTSFDWYTRITTDMVGPPFLKPAVLGADEPDANNTELKSQGWEFIITHKNALNEVKYKMSVGLSGHKETITKYNSEFIRLPDIWNWEPGSGRMHYYEGMEMGEIWGFETIGFITDELTLNEVNNADGNHRQDELYSGEWGMGDILYADLNGDGTVDDGKKTLHDHGDLTVIGNETPDFIFNITMNIQWKGFDFRSIWVGEGPSDFYPRKFVHQPRWYNTWIRKQFFGVTPNVEHPAYEIHLDHWTTDNQDAYYPRPIMSHGLGFKDQQSCFRNTWTQTKYLQNGAYLRLRNVQFGYNLPEKWISKIQCSNARLYISGENLLTMTKLRVFDPESKGMTYPLQKVYSIGFNFQF